MSAERTVGDVDLRSMMEDILAKVSLYNPLADKAQLWAGFEFASAAHAGQKRRSGEPYFAHALTVARILTDLRLDVDTLIAAMVHDVVEDTQRTLGEVEQRFGRDVAHMVDGVTKISGIRAPSREARKAETYRKLVLAIAQDPRTVLIKLADRLHNMRTIGYLDPDRQQDIAQETMDVYAPLAHRFGLAKIKWELEDRAFKVLNPKAYYAVGDGVLQTRADRERLIEEVSRPLQENLTEAGVEAEIVGRPKHFYSIWNKMQTQDIPIERVYDLHALRILVKTKVDCYHALGIVHSLFTPLQDRIKDYIANPKPNMYQSLHTTIRAPGGKFVEIQIRTYEMHERSEIGIAAHWKYKEGPGEEHIDFSRMVSWLKQLMEYQEDVTDPREFMAGMKLDMFQDEVFVYSPRGDIFQLPRGATPLDFAFEVHSAVGLHCVGAKVNGRIVSLTTELKNRDTIEILTSKSAHPGTSWLEIVKTGKARHHIRRWIRSTQFEQSVRLGRDILAREFGRHKLNVNPDKDLDGVAQEMGYTETEKLLAAVGCGDLTSTKVVARLEPRQKKPPEKLVDMGKDIYAALLRRRVSGVKIQGLDSLMVRYARCCEPIPGDQVIGVVTRGRGVSVHRLGCSNLANIEPERLIDVSWDVGEEQVFQVMLSVTALDRRGLLADLSDAIRGVGTNIHSGDFKGDHEVAVVSFLVEVRNLNNLERVLLAVKRVDGVQRVERYQLN